MSVSMNCLSMW